MLVAGVLACRVVEGVVFSARKEIAAACVHVVGMVATSVSCAHSAGALAVCTWW